MHFQHLLLISLVGLNVKSLVYSKPKETPRMGRSVNRWTGICRQGIFFFSSWHFDVRGERWIPRSVPASSSPQASALLCIPAAGAGGRSSRSISPNAARKWKHKPILVVSALASFHFFSLHVNFHSINPVAISLLNMKGVQEALLISFNLSTFLLLHCTAFRT